jgi:DNA polymerase
VRLLALLWGSAEPDCSQIECRLLNFCAGQWDKVEEFRTGADPYVGVASAFYKKPINKKDHPLERQLGKIVELQAGYGSGGNKIRSTVRVKSFGEIILSPAEGVEARDAYRSTHPEVVKFWRLAETMLSVMSANNMDVRCGAGEMGPLGFKCDVAKGTKRIVLPNGIQLIYDTLEFYSDPDDGDRYWRLKTRKGWVKMYGAKLVENLIQALARVVVSQAMIRLKKLGYRCKNTKHDSLWLLIPKGDGRLEEHKAVILREMNRELPWLPGCPLASEFKGDGPAERIMW